MSLLPSVRRRLAFLAVPLLAVGAVPARAVKGSETAGQIETVAGGFGSRQALDVSISAYDVAVGAGRLVVLDETADLPPLQVTFSATVRSIDLATGAGTVVAGDGELLGAFAGDGGPATAARFSAPESVAVGRTGDIFVADTGNNRIRRIDPSGTISTVVGGDQRGFSGDGGPARSSEIDGPMQVSVDASGNLYFVDQANWRVRRVAPDGRIATIAGNGMTSTPAEGAPATETGVGVVRAVAAAPDGAVYLAISHSGIHRVRNGRITRLSTIEAFDIAVDDDGTVYASRDYEIVAVGGDGRVTRMAGDGSEGSSGDLGPALQARVGRHRIAAGDGAVYLGGRGHYRIRRIAGGMIDAFAGNGERSFSGDGEAAREAQLSGPKGLATGADGTMAVVDYYNLRIRRIDPSGVISTVAGTGRVGYSKDHEGGPATQADLLWPYAVAVAPDGDTYFGDDKRIRRIDAAGRISTVAGGSREGFSGDGGPARDATFASIADLAFAADGTLYVADGGNNRVRAISPDGTIRTVAGTDNARSLGDGGPAEKASLLYPWALVARDGEIYLAEGFDFDRNRVRIRRIDRCGVISTVAGGGDGTLADGAAANSGTFAYGPLLAGGFHAGITGLEVDPAGNLFVSDRGGQRIWRIGVDDVAHVIGGTGLAAFSGDGGAARAANLREPEGLVLDRRGGVLVADSGNNRIRRIAGAADEKPGGGRRCFGSPARPGDRVPPVPRPSGYWMVGRDGSVHAFGDARHFGDLANLGYGRDSGPVVDLEPSRSGQGYWIVNEAGHVFAFGSAVSHGDASGATLRSGETVTSISATPSGAGYRLFTTLGRVLLFGDAVSYGDLEGVRLNGAVLDSITTTSGAGYYMVASDGGIFAFGDAEFRGSMGGRRLNAPVQSLVPDRDGRGYWLVASDGGIFAFDASFRGSMGDKTLNRPVTGMVPFGSGYLMVGEDGGIFNFSDRPFAGSRGDNPPASPIVAVAVLDG